MDNLTMSCLEELNNGRNLPPGMIIDPDLSEFNGSVLTVGSMLFFFSGENPRENKTKFGYWKPISNDQNFIYPVVGRRMDMRFYLGHALEGEKTYCVMHEYKILKKDPQGNYTLQDSSSLCKIFWETPGSYEENRDYVHDQLPMILENEGNGQVINGDGPLPGGEPVDGDGPLPGGEPVDGDGPLPGAEPVDGDGPLPGGEPVDGDGPLLGGEPVDGDGPLPGGEPVDGDGPLPGGELVDDQEMVDAIEEGDFLELNDLHDAIEEGDFLEFIMNEIM